MKKVVHKIRFYVLNHKIISVVILIAFLGIGYWGYKKFTNTTGDIRYLTAEVKMGTITASISGSGNCTPFNFRC